MERSSKRGKIPQQDWPSIMARYEAGETLANIARTYDCSPPAISYIVSRSRARGTAPIPNPPPPETEGEPIRLEEPGASVPNEGEQGTDGNVSHPSDPAWISSRNGEAARTLHLPPPHIHDAHSEPGAQSPRSDVIGTSAE